MAIRYRMDGPGRDLTDEERDDFRHELMQTPQAKHLLGKGWSADRIRAAYERSVLPRMRAEEIPDEDFIPFILGAIQDIMRNRCGTSLVRQSFVRGEGLA